MPLRRSSDEATSSGDLSGKIARGDHPLSCNAEDQKGMSRHMRGSLMTARLASPNSLMRADLARVFSVYATAGSMRSGSNGASLPNGYLLLRVSRRSTPQ